MIASCNDFVCEPLPLVKGGYYIEEMSEDDEDIYGCQAGDWAIFHTDLEFEHSTPNGTYKTPLVHIILQFNHGPKTELYASEHAKLLNKIQEQKAFDQIIMAAPCTPSKKSS